MLYIISLEDMSKVEHSFVAVPFERACMGFSMMTACSSPNHNFSDPTNCHGLARIEEAIVLCTYCGKYNSLQVPSQPFNFWSQCATCFESMTWFISNTNASSVQSWSYVPGGYKKRSWVLSREHGWNSCWNVPNVSTRKRTTPSHNMLLRAC